MRKTMKLIAAGALLVLVGFVMGVAVQETPFVYDWEGRQAPVPDQHVFQTKYLGGTQIVFDHKLHADGMGLECIECHHVEGCAHCHREEVTTIDVQESKVALHTNCFVCHEDMSCVDCHEQ
jgi:hypothetical protein